MKFFFIVCFAFSQKPQPQLYLSIFHHLLRLLVALCEDTTYKRAVTLFLFVYPALSVTPIEVRFQTGSHLLSTTLNHQQKHVQRSAFHFHVIFTDPQKSLMDPQGSPVPRLGNTVGTSLAEFAALSLPTSSFLFPNVPRLKENY